MYIRLPIEKKRQLIQEILHGKAVTKVSRESNLSRTIIYRWLKEYKSAARRSKPLVFNSKVKAGKRHWKFVSLRVERKIIKAALTHPENSPLSLASLCGASAHGVWNVLRRHKLNTRQFREAYVERNGATLIPETPSDIKWMAIKRYENGEKVASITKDLGISRVLFYRLLKRYQKENTKSALLSQRPEGEKHWRYAAGAPAFILEIVVKHPEYSPSEIARSLTSLAHKKLLGIHGVYNFLKRNKLNTIELRISYARKHVTQNVIDTTETKAARFQFADFLSFIPPPLRSFENAFRNALPLTILGLLTILFAAFCIHYLWIADGIFAKIGTFFSLVALTFGTFFFLYSLKYYATISIVLSFSRHEKEDAEEDRPFLDTVLSLFGIKITREKKVTKGRENAGGLIPDISRIHLKRHPFVSIHLAMYNEKRVIERLLTAATSMDYDNYEVIVADDSTDEEALTLLEKWKDHPKVKILHRESRDGYKGQALQNALYHTNKQAEFIMIFDADFIPYPDSASSFLKYFQSIIGSLEKEEISKSHVAAVQGYQWHVLNKSENWVTRGVRTEYAGSYVVERSANEIYGGLNQISGSVYMIRRDVVEEIGWGRSITEDFEFTLKLYNKGYKVVYTPYVQAPSEAVSTVKRIIRQRMRWAEGHSYNIKKMFWALMGNPKLSFPEKFELTYLAPYYLQSAFFIAGTFSWFAAELVFKTRLPFWTAVWGWSLIFTNMFALPLMNMVGLFLEESAEKDYAGLLSFVGLSYLVAPFQGYAAIKGFLEKEEGPWFRTPKTGRITDSFTPGHFYRYVKGFFGGKSGVSVGKALSSSFANNPYVALATANNSFNTFSVRKAKKFRWIGKSVLAVFLILAILLNYTAFFVPTKVEAAGNPGIEQQINIVDQAFSTTSTTYTPTTNTLGIFYWDSTKYDGVTSVTFETDINGDSTGLIASGNILPNLTDKTTYTVRLKQTTSNCALLSKTSTQFVSLFTSAGTQVTQSEIQNVSGTQCSANANITVARLRIGQTNSTGIKNSMTQIEIGNNEALSGIVSTGDTPLTNPKIWKFTSANYTGTQGTTLIASVSATITPGSSSRTVKACLWDDTANAEVTNGCTALSSGTSTQYLDTGTATNITLIDRHTYEMRVKSSSTTATTATLVNGKIILTQMITGGGSITAIEIPLTVVNTLATTTSSTYITPAQTNTFGPANWSGATFTLIFEATIKTTAPTTAFAADVNFATSEVNTLSASYVSTRSASLTVPNVATTLQTKIRNSSTSTTSIANSWLLVSTTNLSTPENILLFLPIFLFLPKIALILREAIRRKRKGEKWTVVGQYVRKALREEWHSLKEKMYTSRGSPGNRL